MAGADENALEGLASAISALWGDLPSSANAILFGRTGGTSGGDDVRALFTRRALRVGRKDQISDSALPGAVALVQANVLREYTPRGEPALPLAYLRTALENELLGDEVRESRTLDRTDLEVSGTMPMLEPGRGETEREHEEAGFEETVLPRSSYAKAKKRLLDAAADDRQRLNIGMAEIAHELEDGVRRQQHRGSELAWLTQGEAVDHCTDRFKIHRVASQPT